MFALNPRKEREKVGYPMIGLPDEFMPLFDRFFGGWPVLFEPYTEPEHVWGLEVEDADKELVVRAEVPGFEPAEMAIELWDNMLMIRAEKKHEAEEKKPYEFTRYGYERLVDLPVAVTPEKAEACYRNGVLEVHLPKAEEAAVRLIPVKGILSS